MSQICLLGTMVQEQEQPRVQEVAFAKEHDDTHTLTMRPVNYCILNVYSRYCIVETE